ncbi:hypothetical protein CHS0354_000634 [Potamilus streckersoni]|uniref:Translation initiation factor IF-2, chloroplastic n=1 Tax=Potamilus streckersoni TaxID=2493646 RepID=A0AAE0T6X3_9BIVA|nr:hypothetical protein CHS0354_000634 [Potamilus streckersoni]
MPKKDVLEKKERQKKELVIAFNSLEDVGKHSKKKEEDTVKASVSSTLTEIIKKQLKKDFDPDVEARVIINSDRGDFEVYIMKEIVEEVDMPLIQISLADARKIDEDFEVGDIYEDGPVRLDSLLSRKSIQIIKQSVQKKMRDFERSAFYKECKELKGEVVTGEFYQALPKEILFTYAGMKDTDIELSLPLSEKIPKDHFVPKTPYKLFVKDVVRPKIKVKLEDGTVVEKESEEGPVIITVSRVHDDLLRRMFEREVPEIEDGLIVIKAVARVPGERAKIAVESTVGRIDPVGACVGHRGSRIKGIVKELNNENIDVIGFSDEMQVYIARALQPAKIDPMDIAVDFKAKEARVVVKKEQIKFTIGRNGNNIFLAEKLTGFNIEILRQFRSEEEEQNDIDILAFRDDFGDDVVYRLVDAGYDTAMRILKVTDEELAEAMMNLKEVQLFGHSHHSNRKAFNMKSENDLHYWLKIAKQVKQIVLREMEAHDIAQELNVSAQDILEFLNKERKINAKTTTSKVTKNDKEAVYEKFSSVHFPKQESSSKSVDNINGTHKPLQKETIESLNVEIDLGVEGKIENEVTEKKDSFISSDVPISPLKIVGQLTLDQKAKLSSLNTKSASPVESQTEEKKKIEYLDQQTFKVNEKNDDAIVSVKNDDDFGSVLSEEDTEKKVEGREDSLLDAPKNEKLVNSVPLLIDEDVVITAEMSVDMAEGRRRGLKTLGTIEHTKREDRYPRKKSFKEQKDDLEKLKKAKDVLAAKKVPTSETVEEKRTMVSKKSSGKKGDWVKKEIIDDKTLERNIRQTIFSEKVTEVETRQRYKRNKRIERVKRQEEADIRRELDSRVIRVTEYISTNELAGILGVTVKDIIERCFNLGKMVTINQRLDREILELLAIEFDREVHFISEQEEFDLIEADVHEVDLKKCPPVVTIMGHVDHGKTSLLDFIRRSNIIAGESGGITQHIGAYEVMLENGSNVSCLDTPGHEAFTAWRARGAEGTGSVMLVVGANDSVMPLSVEALSHAKAANVPIVVAINKIDLPEANSEKIKAQLSENGVLVEEWGGNVQVQEISAKKGQGVKELLEKVLIQADVMDLKSNYNEHVPVKGVIVEAELDKGKGVVATVLVQSGILNLSKPFVAGQSAGRVRAMFDERGKRVDRAFPSQPVRVLGFEELPNAGDMFVTFETDREAREVAERRRLIRREQSFRSSNIRLDEVSKGVQLGNKIKDLRVILKADTSGSVEAISDKLMKLENSEIKIQIVHKGVGQVNERDVLLAAASKAIVLSFRIRPNLNARKLAEKEGVEIRYYNVIYHAIEEVQAALEGMLSPEISEKEVGLAEVRHVYKSSKIGNVAGCYVLEGKVKRDWKSRLIRDGIQIFEGNLASLRRFKDDVKEVEMGYECGISFQGYDDLKVGDMIEIFEIVETKRKFDFE